MDRFRGNDFCNLNRKKFINTFFQHRPSHKYTWYGWNNEKQTYDRQTQIGIFWTTDHRFVTNNKTIPSVPLDSDHRFVIMNTKYKFTAIRLAEKKKRVRVQELRNSKEKRQQFQQCLSKRTRDGEGNAHGQIEELWTILKRDINASIVDTIGFKWSCKTKRKQTAWWTDILRANVKEKQRFFRQFMKQRTPVAREAYVKARREAYACKRNIKSESWNCLCEDLALDVNGTKKLIPTCKFLPKRWPTETFQQQSSRKRRGSNRTTRDQTMQNKQLFFFAECSTTSRRIDDHVRTISGCRISIHYRT